LGKQVKSEKERGYINFVKGEKENKTKRERRTRGGGNCLRRKGGTTWVRG